MARTDLPSASLAHGLDGQFKFGFGPLAAMLVVVAGMIGVPRA